MNQVTLPLTLITMITNILLAAIVSFSNDVIGDDQLVLVAVLFPLVVHTDVPLV